MYTTGLAIAVAVVTLHVRNTHRLRFPVAATGGNVKTWHDANPLAHTSGRAWVYQPSQANSAKLTIALRKLSTAWSTPSADKVMRPVMTVASAPGTGKSRLLDELQDLCSVAAAHALGNLELAGKLRGARVFKVSFENGTPFNPDNEGGSDGNAAVGTRMMWQLVDSDTRGQDFSTYRARNAFTISDALRTLSEITTVPREKQTIFLLVDGLQRLLPNPHPAPAPESTTFRSAINAVSACVNSFPESVIGAVAATLALPIESVFGLSAAGGGSQQLRIYLQPPPLIHPEVVR